MGDPCSTTLQYYSSHAAILENLVSSKKGDNIFIIVIDLRKTASRLGSTCIIGICFVGSHSDKIAREKIEGKRLELRKFCD